MCVTARTRLHSVPSFPCKAHSVVTMKNMDMMLFRCVTQTTDLDVDRAECEQHRLRQGRKDSPQQKCGGRMSL